MWFNTLQKNKLFLYLYKELGFIHNIHKTYYHLLTQDMFNFAYVINISQGCNNRIRITWGCNNVCRIIWIFQNGGRKFCMKSIVYFFPIILYRYLLPSSVTVKMDYEENMENVRYATNDDTPLWTKDWIILCCCIESVTV